MNKSNPMTEPPPPYQIGGGGVPGTQSAPPPGFMPNQPTAVFPAQPGIKFVY